MIKPGDIVVLRQEVSVFSTKEYNSLCFCKVLEVGKIDNEERIMKFSHSIFLSKEDILLGADANKLSYEDFMKIWEEEELLYPIKILTLDGQISSATNLMVIKPKEVPKLVYNIFLKREKEKQESKNMNSNSYL